MTFTSITAREYDDALGLLPPRLHLARGFLLGEPYSERTCAVTGYVATTWQAFFNENGQHFQAEPMTYQEFRRACQTFPWRNTAAA